MASRLQLHEELCELLGSRNVYYQPPETVKMQYDAIRYWLSGKELKHANNKVYGIINRYDGVIITLDPDTVLPDAMLMRFDMCSFGKPYVSDNLYHFPFTIYY